jgi:uncharacterized protein
MEPLRTMTTPEQSAEQSPALEVDSLQAPTAPEPPALAAPAVADGVEHPLDPRHIALDRVSGWIFTGSVALGGIVTILILALTPVPGWVKAGAALLWAAVILALGWFSYRWPVVEHRHASYKVDEAGIEIRRGVLWRKVINVPRSRVQHTDVSQGPLERRYGLGTLVLYTAGTDHAKVDLPGLDHATALAIRDHLLAGEGGDAV